MKQQKLGASVIVAVALLILLLSIAGESVARGKGTEEVRPQMPTLTLGATETLTPAAYLPLVKRNFPPPIEVPQGQYLLAESWEHSVLCEDCARLCIDFPTYHFDPHSGELWISFLSDPGLTLKDEDLGYLGTGTSLGGVGCGVSSDLTKIQRCPLSQDNITLQYVTVTGTIIVDRAGELIVLATDEGWVSEVEVENWDWLGQGCIVTTTHYVTNYGFQERDKIIYSQDSRRQRLQFRPGKAIIAANHPSTAGGRAPAYRAR